MAYDKDHFSETYCTFGDERVYLLMALARSSDNDSINASNQPTIRKVAQNPTDLRRKIRELKHATSRFDYRYRLYMSVNARHTPTAGLRLRQEMERWIGNEIGAGLGGGGGGAERFSDVGSEWKSILHQPESAAESRFLFDVDDPQEVTITDITSRLKEETEILWMDQSASPNSFHVVTEPFNHNAVTLPDSVEMKTDADLFIRYINE